MMLMRQGVAIFLRIVKLHLKMRMKVIRQRQVPPLPKKTNTHISLLSLNLKYITHLFQFCYTALYGKQREVLYDGPQVLVLHLCTLEKRFLATVSCLLYTLYIKERMNTIGDGEF